MRKSEYLFDPLQRLLSPSVVNSRAWSHRRLLRSMQRETQLFPNHFHNLLVHSQHSHCFSLCHSYCLFCVSVCPSGFFLLFYVAIYVSLFLTFSTGLKVIFLHNHHIFFHNIVAFQLSSGEICVSNFTHPCEWCESG